MSTAQRTRITKMIVTELLSSLSGSGIELIGPNEPAPEQDLDDDDATVHDRWCKLEWPKLTPHSSAPRTADAQVVTLTLSVGAGNAAVASDEYQVSKDVDTVVDALRGLHAAHAPTGHELDIKEAEGEPIESMGSHTRSMLGVITASGLATRVEDPA